MTVRLESRDGAIRGELDGATFRFSLPADDQGLPELTDDCVKGLREMLNALRVTRRRRKR